MNDEVQLHVDLPRSIWKAMKVEAIESGDTLKGVATKCLSERFGPSNARKQLSNTSEVVKALKSVEAAMKSPGDVSAPKNSVVEEGATVLVGALPNEDKLELWHRCAGRCGENHPQSRMTYHSKEGKWVCNDCVANMKNNQS